jgi:hypothetical protein
VTAASLLIAASAAVALVLGTLHLVLTFSGDRLFPRDPSLIERMKEVSPRISRQTTIWRAGVGFHASHSFGAMLFGLIYLYLALQASPFLFASTFLVVLGFVYLAAMTWLARLYWFSVPFRGIAVAAILYAAGVAAYAT